MKKVKYVALVLILAFGLIGGAYAAWTDNLEIGGTVATGDIDVVFVTATSNDPAGTPDPGQPEGKDVAVTEVVISECEKFLTVTVDNAYPGYVSTIDFEVTNKGSVPVKLQDKNIDVVSGDPAGLEVENWGWWCFSCGNWAWKCTCDDTPPPAPQLEIGSQIHDGDIFAGSVGHLVTDDAEMNASYTYTVSYDFIQWNYFEEAAE